MARRGERDHGLPSAEALQRVEDGVLGWWNAAYLAAGNAALPRRFVDEARASLPAMDPAAATPDPNEVYAAVGLQRLRLHRDQQVPEWTG